MGRKRYSSYVESSDDDFGFSDSEGSPVFSRLKRPRRSHTKASSPPSPSPDRNSYRPEDDQNSSVVIPDSLDQDDKSVVESEPDSAPHSPRDPGNDDTRDTEEAPGQGDGEGDAGFAGDDDDVVVGVDESSGDGTKFEQSPKKHLVQKDDNTTSSGRRRQARKVYHVDSESEQSDDGNEDDDAYNSAEDSPPDDGDDSEFDFSPKKPTKKKEKTPAKRAPGRQPAKTPPARKLATRTLATRKLATKPVLAVTKKPSSNSLSMSKVATTAKGAARSLGARLPHRGLMPAKASGADKKRTQPIGRLPSGPVIRSGLSRKAAIPRLHAYLPK